jgi:hypothetical protein
VLHDPEEGRYPSRILAARAAYLDGVPVEQIKAVLSSSLRFDEDPGAQWWQRLMHQRRFAKRGNKQDTDWALQQLPGPRNKAPALRRVRKKLADKA